MIPILLLLVSGSADLARAFFVGIQISDGARQAVLYAANTGATPSQSTLKAIAEQDSGTSPLACPSGALHLTPGPTSTSSSLPSGAYYQPIVVWCDLPMFTPGIPSPIRIQTTVTALIVP